MFLRAVCTFLYEFGCRVSVDCIVHFVLHRGVESLCRGGVFVVVNRRRIKVCYFLIEFPFACAYFTHTLKLLFKIFIGEVCSPLQPFFVHYPSFDGVFAGYLVDPFSELDRAL